MAMALSVHDCSQNFGWAIWVGLHVFMPISERHADSWGVAGRFGNNVLARFHSFKCCLSYFVDDHSCRPWLGIRCPRRTGGECRVGFGQHTPARCYDCGFCVCLVANQSTEGALRIEAKFKILDDNHCHQQAALSTNALPPCGIRQWRVCWWDQMFILWRTAATKGRCYLDNYLDQTTTLSPHIRLGPQRTQSNSILQCEPG